MVGGYSTRRHITQRSEGLAQGPSVAAKVGFEPATFPTKGAKHHHSTTTPLSPV